MKQISIKTIMLLMIIFSGAALAQTPDTAYFWAGGSFDDEYQWHDTIYSGVNLWIDIPVYFMGGPDVAVENLNFPLAVRYDLIDEFNQDSCQMFYPLTSWYSHQFLNYNDDTHPTNPNPPGYHSLSFFGWANGLDSGPFLRSDVPLHILSFRVHVKHDTMLSDQTFCDVLTPGIDPVRGPAYAGDSTGSIIYPIYLSHSCLRIYRSYAYLPGDVNMIGGCWPPCTTGPDVTYLVGSFKGPRLRCYLGGFWCSADANGDCIVIGNDVTYLVNVFRGIGSAK